MSFGGGFFGGGEKKTTTYATTTSFAADWRTAVEGGLGGGTLVGPGANVGAPGSITTRLGDYSTLNQNLSGSRFRVGMTGAEVKDLLVQQADISGRSLASVADFGNRALQVAAAAQTGELANWQRYLPILIIGVVAFAAVRHRRS